MDGVIGESFWWACSGPETAAELSRVYRFIGVVKLCELDGIRDLVSESCGRVEC